MQDDNNSTTGPVIYDFECILLSAFRGQLMATRVVCVCGVFANVCEFLAIVYGPAHFLLQYVALANNAISCCGPAPEQIALHKLCECQKVFGD